MLLLSANQLMQNPYPLTTSHVCLPALIIPGLGTRQLGKASGLQSPMNVFKPASSNLLPLPQSFHPMEAAMGVLADISPAPSAEPHASLHECAWLWRGPFSSELYVISFPMSDGLSTPEYNKNLQFKTLEVTKMRKERGKIGQ